MQCGVLDGTLGQKEDTNGKISATQKVAFFGGRGFELRASCLLALCSTN
jgi:hypothetical protein